MARGRLLAMGHDNSSIARRLTVSRGTVLKHLENIYARLGVQPHAAVACAFPDATCV